MSADEPQAPDDPKAAVEIRHILFPTDFSDVALHALRYARNFAQMQYATLHCLHVVDEAYQYLSVGPDTVPIGPPMEHLIAQAKKELAAFVEENLANESFPIKRSVVCGPPFMEIIHYARKQEIDLIVIGTHGRTGLKHVLLGSVAEKVIRKASCPVLSVRHPEQEFVMP